MNKKIIICLLLILLCGCHATKETDCQKFKSEYEQYNGKKDDNGLTYVEVNISDNSRIKYAEKDKLYEIMTNGTHVVYLGWPTCPYCRLCVPVLLDTIDEYSGISMYYYNIKEMRESYIIQDDDSNLYKQISDLVLNSCPEADAFEKYDDGTLKLPASTFYFIKDGNIIGLHRGTVQSHLNVYEELDDQQIEELKNIYRNYLNEMIKKDPIGCSEC